MKLFNLLSTSGQLEFELEEETQRSTCSPIKLAACLFSKTQHTPPTEIAWCDFIAGGMWAEVGSNEVHLLEY